MQLRVLSLPTYVVVQPDVLAGLYLIDAGVIHHILLLGLNVVVKIGDVAHYYLGFLHYVNCVWDLLLHQGLALLTIKGYLSLLWLSGP